MCSHYRGYEAPVSSLHEPNPSLLSKLQEEYNDIMYSMKELTGSLNGAGVSTRHFSSTALCRIVAAGDQKGGDRVLDATFRTVPTLYVK